MMNLASDPEMEDAYPLDDLLTNVQEGSHLQRKLERMGQQQPLLLNHTPRA